MVDFTSHICSLNLRSCIYTYYVYKQIRKEISKDFHEWSVIWYQLLTVENNGINGNRSDDESSSHSHGHDGCLNS